MTRGMRLVLSLMTLLLLVAGCAKPPAAPTSGESAGAEPAGATTGPKTATPSGPAAATGPITLRVFALNDPGLNAAIAAYQAKHENVRIEKVPFERGGRTTDLIIMDLVEQRKVDLVHVIGAPQLLEANALMVLDPFLQRDRVDLTPHGPVIDQMRFDGRLYDLPTTFQADVLLYNTDLFKQAGLAAPQKGWTWEQFREAAQRLSQGEGAGKTWGYTAPLDEDLMRIYLSHRTGQRLALQDYDDVKETLRFFGTMVWSDRSIEPAKKRDWTKFGFNLTFTTFEQGRAGMTLTTLQMLHTDIQFGSLKKTAWDIAPMPATGPGVVTPIRGVEAYGIAATTEQAEAAWQFLRFMTGPEGAIAMAKQGLVPMYRTPEVKQAWFERQPAPPPGTEYLFDTEWTISSRSTDSLTQKLYGPLNNAFNRMLTGEQTWEDAFAQYKQEAERIVAEAKSS